MDQVTAVFELPLTVAVNCALWDAMRFALGGLMPTLTLGGAGSEIVPVFPFPGMESPAAVDATTPEIWIAIDVVDGFDAIWKVATATVPSGIVVLLNPRSRQLFAEHVTLFPALTAEPPGTTLTLVISDV
jgi:hypothetical protein